MGPFLPVDRPGPGGLKGRGTLDSQDSLRSSVALLPAALASSGFIESAEGFLGSSIRI